MPIKKYINTAEVAMLTGLQQDDIRNHAKVVIDDDQMAYVGSANITPAGIGQGVFTPGNFEVGILKKNPEIVSSVTTLFYTIWNKAHCDKCHRADMCNAKNL